MPAAEITRAETGQRARLLDVGSYDVTLDLTRGDEVFGSTCLIRFSCAQPGPAAASYADLIAVDVREITLNGVPLDPQECWADGRITLAGLAADNELRVVADCAYSRDGTGLHRATDPADLKVYTYTKFEPAYARGVYACFEQPDLKAAFTISVIAPGHWTVLSNEPLAAAEPGPGQATVWRFKPTERLPTYLFAVVAGEYHVIRAAHTTPRGQQIPLALACRASLAAHLDEEAILEVTRAGLDYYTELFDTDYPFAKYDQAFVPEYSVGATENAGCVVFTDQLLFRSRVTDGLHQVRASVILHEMAHMWFGDLVTMAWWDDLWLNESFAELAAAQSSAEATRFTGAWATFCLGRKAGAYSQDQLPSTHPVAADVGTLSEAIANFDAISYSKGAAVLRQLAARIGRDAFYAGIHRYFAAHAFGNATLADWLAALSAGAGTDLTGWARAWLQTAGPSTLRPEFTVDAAGAFTSFTVCQQAASGDPVLRPHKIAIGLYEGVEDGALVRTGQVAADIDGHAAPVPALTGRRQPDLILLNDDDLTYALLRFDDRSLATLARSIGELADPLARAVCWTSLSDMVRQAELAAGEFVAMVARALPAEDSVLAVQILADTCAGVLSTLASPPDAETGRATLAAVAARELASAEPGSDHQLSWAQLLSWTVTEPGQLDLAAGLLDGSVVPAGLVVSAELRWLLLSRLAATGRAGDKEIDAELSRDHTDGGARSAAAARAAIGDASHKQDAWRLLTQPGGMAADLLRSVAAGFHQSHQAELLARYCERYFDLLPGLWAGGSGHLRAARASALFPVTAAGPELLERIDAFLAERPREPGLARVLVERRDQVRLAIASRALSSSEARSK